MATVNDVLIYARNLAQTDSNGLTDTVGLTFCNDAQQNIVREMLDRDIDAAQTQESYTSLSAGQGSYAWPTDMYSLKTIELDYTGVGGQNYVQAGTMDVSNIQNQSFDQLRKTRPTNAPVVDNRGDTFEVFPTPIISSANGIRIFYWLIPTEYATTASTLAYPMTLDYRCLSARVAMLWCNSTEKFNVAAKCESEYDKRLKQIIQILAPGTQQPIQPQRLQITGFEF